jgi:DNA-directed RNA polymerase subunit RPC12/RpoP
MAPSGICPACEHQVLFQTVAIGTYKCSNCWHLVDRTTLDKLEQLAADLAAHDAARAKLFEKLR